MMNKDISSFFLPSSFFPSFLPNSPTRLLTGPDWTYTHRQRNRRRGRAGRWGQIKANTRHMRTDYLKTGRFRLPGGEARTTRCIQTGKTKQTEKENAF